MSKSLLYVSVVPVSYVYLKNIFQRLYPMDTLMNSSNDIYLPDLILKQFVPEYAEYKWNIDAAIINS